MIGLNSHPRTEHNHRAVRSKRSTVLANIAAVPLPLSLAMFLGCASLLTACGGIERAANEGVASVSDVPTPSVRMAVKWQTHVGGHSVLDLRPSEFGGVALSENGRSLIVVAQNGEISNLDPGTGDSRWSIHRSDSLSSSPVIDRGLVYIAAHDGTLTAYGVNSGEERWQKSFDAMLNGNPLIVGNDLFVSTAAESLIVLDKGTGEERWRHKHERFTELDVRGGPTPLVTDDSVFVGFSDGTLFRLDRATGSVVWSADLAGGSDELRDVDQQPLLIDGVLYANSFNGGVWALEAASGRELWHLKLLGSGRLLPLPDKRLLTVTSGGRLVWIDATFGEELYDLSLGSSGLSGPVPLTDELAAVFDSSEGLRIVATTRPFVHSEFRPGGGIDATPSVRNDTIYLLTNNGFVYAIGIHRL